MSRESPSTVLLHRKQSFIDKEADSRIYASADLTGGVRSKGADRIEFTFHVEGVRYRPTVKRVAGNKPSKSP